MSTLKVAAIQGVSASSDAITLANDGTCTANITNNLSNRNLIINGAMQVAQRGTSSTSAGIQTVDRFQVNHNGADEAPTQAQVDVTSGTTPYTLGFRKAFKITNGNQTSGAETGDFINYQYIFEAQDIANSGWNYVSSSSNVTLSFWIKSSVAQNFYGHLQTVDGTAQNYPFETGSLSADTWTKITKTITGNSNLTFNNDNGEGLKLFITAFYGTDYTGSVSLNTWAAYASGTKTPDQTSTWYTTNDSTLEITGVQLEVGSVATDFEHRSFGDELARCQRYYFKLTGDDNDFLLSGFTYSASLYWFIVNFPQVMRAFPTYTGSATAARFYSDNISQDFNFNTLVNGGVNHTTTHPSHMWLQADQGGANAGAGGSLQAQNAVGTLEFSSEL